MSGINTVLYSMGIVLCLIILLCILVGRRHRDLMELVYLSFGIMFVFGAIGFMVFMLWIS